MRIWYQTMADVSRYPKYAEALRARASGLLRPDTEVDVHGVATGTYGELPPGNVSIHPLAYHVLLDQVVGNAIRAEREGFDVVALGSYSEPHLRVIRSAVDIPVVSLAEATMLTGCTLGRKVGIVTTTKSIQWMIEHLVDNHHLRERIAPIRVTDPEFTEDDLRDALVDPKPLIAAFEAAARASIDDFADVLIPGEGIFSQILADNGVRSVDGVSVMDCQAVTLLSAETMAILHRTTGLIQGRRWEYLKPGPEINELIRAHAGNLQLSGAQLAPPSTS